MDMERNYVIVAVCLPGVWKVKHLCVSTAGLTALSNMPVIGSSPVLVADDERSMADDDDSWIKDDFATTPIMSTYLLAFVVADFRSRQTTGHHGLKVRNNNNYYTVSQKKQDTKLLAITSLIITDFQNFSLTDSVVNLQQIPA